MKKTLATLAPATAVNGTVPCRSLVTIGLAFRCLSQVLSPTANPTETSTAALRYHSGKNEPHDQQMELQVFNSHRTTINAQSRNRGCRPEPCIFQMVSRPSGEREGACWDSLAGVCDCGVVGFAKNKLDYACLYPFRTLFFWFPPFSLS